MNGRKNEIIKFKNAAYLFDDRDKKYLIVNLKCYDTIKCDKCNISFINEKGGYACPIYDIYNGSRQSFCKI